jgi:hypothetical protein
VAAKRVVLPPLKQRRSPNFSPRHGSPIDLLVWHETAGRYRGDIATLCNDRVAPHLRVSAHLVVREDGAEVTQLVRLAQKAWTQGFYNPRAVGVEHSNMTAKGYSTEQQLRVSARIFAWLAWDLDVPVRFARGGHGRGVCRHLDLGALGGGHTQCGPGDATWQRFLGMLHAETERGGFRKTWAL